MVDKVMLLRKLAEMEDYLGEIKEFSHITPEDYAKDWKTQRIVERTLQIMIEICVDIANHIIADRKYRVPFSYADTFKVLQEEGIIHAELSGNMERMARFRNILVHHYNKLDASTMVTLLREQLEDFLRYKDSILRTLESP
ncbi:MAG TPA: type VII toxin-antitoxin system HepT family RNase toxin [Candidatus Hypogeohydataceae bacterium YC38]